MIDIVERLRRTIAANESGKFHLLIQEAADEIERLRKIVERMTASMAEARRITRA